MHFPVYFGNYFHFIGFFDFVDKIDVKKLSFCRRIKAFILEQKPDWLRN